MNNNINDLQKQLSKGKYFLVFKTTWCPDCKMMEPIYKAALTKIHKEISDIELIEVDAEEYNVFRKSDSPLDVLKVPSFFVVNDGTFNHIGYEYIPEEIIIEKIKQYTKK